MDRGYRQNRLRAYIRDRAAADWWQRDFHGAMAQLVAHLLCKQGVRGSSPLSSTNKIGPPFLGVRSCLQKVIGLEPREGWTSGRKPRWGFRSGPVRGKLGRAERAVWTRSGHAKRTREADTRVPLAPLSGGARTRESTVRAINHTYAHVISVDCCHNRGLLPQPWTVAATVDCCRNRGLLPQPWTVAATVVSRRNRGFSVSRRGARKAGAAPSSSGNMCRRCSPSPRR